MKEKKKVTSMVAITLLVVSFLFVGMKSFGASDKLEKTEVGRFQLFQGTCYEVILAGHKSTGEKKPAVFLLDSSSGKVWRYATGIESGKLFEYWSYTGSR